jgi:ribosomal protein L11
MIASTMSEHPKDDDVAAGWTKQGFDRLLSVHRPVVLAHLRSIRKRNPAASPDEVIRVLEKRYVRAVTAGGAATGAAAVVPGVGTIAAIGISGAETVGFLEASALFAQSVAEIHGVATADPERSSTMVMALMLGPAGANLVQQFAGEIAGTGKPRSAYWGELVTKRLPSTMLKTLTDRVRKSFVRRFATRQGANLVFRVVPFGIGAVVGGAGNRISGQRVVTSAREAFGPAPATFPEEIRLPDPPRPVTG